MRKVIALDESTGSTNVQDDEPCSYHRLLGVVRSAYERIDIKQPRAAKVSQPMAEISWADARSTADKLKDASDLALRLELLPHGYEVAGNVLAGRWPSGKPKHRRKNKSQ
jgi:hypothetical protein